jgi:hypothetical protein
MLQPCLFVFSALVILEALELRKRETGKGGDERDQTEKGRDRVRGGERLPCAQ